MITLFISGVATISLFVGGIGVLVSVTERIGEVGLIFEVYLVKKYHHYT